MCISEIPNNSLYISIKKIVDLSRKLCNDHSFDYAPLLNEEEIKK